MSINTEKLLPTFRIGCLLISACFIILTLLRVAYFFQPRTVVLVDVERHQAFRCRVFVDLDSFGRYGTFLDALYVFFIGPNKLGSRRPPYEISEITFLIRDIDFAAERAIMDREDRLRRGVVWPVGWIDWEEYGEELLPWENILRNRDVPYTVGRGWISGSAGIGDVPSGWLKPMAEIIGLDESDISVRARHCRAVVHLEQFFHGRQEPEAYWVINSGYLISGF